jgi:voltage-gated potassium channel
VAGLAIATTVIAAVAYSVFEGTGPLESFYWSIVSGSSTGYGDITPKTRAGRIVTVIYLTVALWVITPILTARIAAYMIVNNDAWTDGEQEKLKSDVTAIKEKLGA